MDMPFIGKWSLATAAGDAVYADPSSGRLMVGTAPAAAQARFNAYGTLASCILQAAGGKYVAAIAQGPSTTFAATLGRDASPATFAITAGSGNKISVAWQGPPAQAWSDAKGALTAGSGPGAQFAQTIVTPALAGLAPMSGMDMSWVYLAGLDLTSLMQLSGVNLTGADLAGADLSGMSLDQAVLTGADLSNAKLGMATLGSATLRNAVFTGAHLNGAVMNGVQADGAILSGASAKGVSLNNASLRGAKLIGTDLSGFGSSIVHVDFTGADLTSAVFTAASVRTLALIDANLTGVQLSNPATNPSIDLSDATVSAKTNLTRAHLQYVDLRGRDLSHVLMTHADLTGSKLDNTKLIGAEMGYVNLTGVTMTGNIPMFGANLSNATMTGVNLAGAQLGSISVLFRVVDDSSGQQAYTAFLTALNAGDPTGVTAAFRAAGVTLTAPVSVLASPSSPGRVWTVNAAQSTYTIRLETVNATASLATYQPQTAAVLVNAYMKDAILTSANLYNVSASGVQLYGKALLDGHTILEGAQFDDANLSGLNLKQAGLYGVSFAHATLTGAQLDGAQLTPAANGAQASFANANLQGVSFKDAALAYAILTDAAVAVPADDGTSVAGVWLFSSAAPNPIAAQLTAATKQFPLPVQLAGQLTQGTVSAPMIKAFAAKGVTLSSSAVVVPQAQGPLWTIADGTTTYRLFYGCDQDNYVPAVGVSTSAVLVPAFTVPLYLQADLNHGGAVSAAVAAAFTTAGHTLGAGATVSVGTMPTDWIIVDAAAGSYDLWLGLDLDCTLTITVRPSMPAVIDLFAGNSVALTRRATVSAQSAGHWAVDNDSNNPFNAVTNYIKYNLATNASAGELDVYGSFLRVRQVGPDGVSVLNNVQIALTALTQSQLQPSTVCPNSSRTQTNIDEGVPFPQWMRARELPKPPFCVPSADGAFYCPPPAPS